jgi:hypothetical protein
MTKQTKTTKAGRKPSKKELRARLLASRIQRCIDRENAVERTNKSW